jgi:hypothetical protein
MVSSNASPLMRPNISPASAARRSAVSESVISSANASISPL